MNLDFKEIEEYPLGDDDIRQILGDNISILTYPELSKYNDIDDILDDQNRVVILFLTTDKYTGHWLCIHKDDNEAYHYFDPYGTGVENNKKWLSYDKLVELNQSKPLMMNILKKSHLTGIKNKVYYNTYDFQDDKMGINTCGRHICTRLLYKDMDLNDYYDMIKKSNLKPDKFVSLVTYNIIKK